MKKLLTLFCLLLVYGCSDGIFEPKDFNESIVPESLQIGDSYGLKAESVIVSDEMNMNIKLPYDGIYRIKIKDISRELISQEKITANEGNNLLKVYVSSLPKNGYILELTNDAHEVLGLTTFVVI